MDRRQFLHMLAVTSPAIFLNSTVVHAAIANSRSNRLFEQDPAADLLIVGGGLGGCAAALSAAKAGLRVILSEETDWIGGQLTSQAVPPDEHNWIEEKGATAHYRQFRQQVRQFYRDFYPLTPRSLRTPHWNPGGGMVSRLCHEPRVALAVLYQMLLPQISGGRLSIMLHHVPLRAEVDGDRVRTVTLRNQLDRTEVTVSVPYFIDATETGELLPLTGTEYVSGFESQTETEEPHAPAEAQPSNMQAVTWCFPMEYVADRGLWDENRMERPEQYDFWKSYVPQLSPAWPGRLFDWTYTHPITRAPRTLAFDPEREVDGWWLYRRIVCRDHFLPGTCRGSVTLVNWPQNDYLLGNLYGVPEDEAALHREGARQLSLSWMYWMQTEAPRPDWETGWPGLRQRPDLVDTRDGLAKSPYIRESRRIRAKFTVLEQHISTSARMEATGLPEEQVAAAPFADSVGVGSYRIDLHPSTGGDNYIDLSSLRFQIPLGALLPRRTENLIAGAKNIGVTHITNGCYRLHPVEWNIGEAAGLLVAQSIQTRQTPHAIYADPELLDSFQQRLSRQGVELTW